ncbi:SPOR domain-containing protein [Solidesulfovibrio sp.]|uniref:SPOR domain-containing protein n=1 Tax=Solidesulfovibrio sp. TaxID=2910990 RepID=UPI002B1E958C|nr:SPOR domain-containing protein [Solidesulfovibrio sp.]MEA4858090.1 SPOR domain-containing protein [Solidesulfovibrio sp.]
MPGFAPPYRLVAACLILAALAWPRPARAGVRAAVAPAPAGEAGPVGGVFEACGALAAEPGLVEAWPGAMAVRLGEAVAPSDKGLGCRFVLPGKPGGKAVAVEARLTRPSADGDGQAVDRWFVPARPGEPAVAAYAFFPLGPPAPGPWRLELAAGDKPLGAWNFIVSPPSAAAQTPAEAPGAPGVAASIPIASPPASSPSAASPAAPAKPGPEADPASPKPPPAKAAPTAAPSRGSPSAATGSAAARPREVAKGFVALQTGLFADAENAAVLAARLRARGMPACVAKEGQGATARHRVLAGRFGDRRAALASREAVRAAVGVWPLVVEVDAAKAEGLRCR